MPKGMRADGDAMISAGREYRETLKRNGLCIRCKRPKNPLSACHCDNCLDYLRARYVPKALAGGRPCIPRERPASIA